MSIKIHEGWRWDQSKHGFWSVIGKIQNAAKKEIEKRLKRFVVASKIQKNPKARWEMAQILGQHTQQARFSLCRDMYDMNTVFFVRGAGDYALLMPCDSRRDYGFMKKIKELEDFKYYNNTDRPADITAKEWKSREKFWLKYWKPNLPAIEFSALDTMMPGKEILDIMCPDFMDKDGGPEGYWDIDKKTKKKNKKAYKKAEVISTTKRIKRVNRRSKN